MDYARIYREFIADRKTKPAPSGYSEKHHILPRSLGGGDEASNLIALTPEDHFFAHLLLAKAHGGSQWGGVWCMAKMINKASVSRSVFSARYMVGVARRKWSAEQSRIKSGQRREYSDRVATLYNVDGRAFTGSRSQLSAMTGLSLASVSRLCNGMQGVSWCGWYFSEEAMKETRFVKAESGRCRAANVAGKNRKVVKRIADGATYPSLSVAAEANGTNTSNISRAIRCGVRAGGFLWSYA